ncbi:MAG: DMT family transporter [Actinomycetota bacterium]|nr:DMT family transporter [Actinomycetota bacterium]
MERRLAIGRVAAVGATALLAAGPSIVKLSDLAETRFVFWRLVLASVFYGLISLVSGDRPTRSELRHALWGGLVFALNLVFFVAAMRRTSVANAVVIGALQPVVLLGLTGPLFGERPRRALYGWSALAIGGVSIAMHGSGGDGIATRFGDLLALVGMLLFCLYYVVSKRARAEVGSVSYQLGLTVVAAVLMVPLVLASGHGIGPPSGEDWWPVVLMVFLPGTGHLLTNYAHAYVPLALMGLINLLFVALVPLYAWWLVGEALGGLQAVGVGLLIATLAMVVTRPVEQSDSRG